MKKELFNYIQALSLSDKKTLFEKGLKTAEETGELCSKLLAFNNAPNNTHRFITEENIIEEVADTILSAISVAYNLGANTETIFEMIEKKAEYWGSLQAKEKKAKYPLPFELHITVKNDSNLQKFKDVCESLSVKPILLDLQSQNGDDVVLKDLMTSSKHYGTNQDAYNEMMRIAGGLTNAGFEVLRKKVETSPMHPQAPSSMDIKIEPMQPGNYFESHIGVILHKHRKDELVAISEKHNAHFSRNTMKRYNEDVIKQMITLRSTKDTFETFKEIVKNLTDELVLKDFETEKPIIEYSIYDSRVSHDKNWIG